MKRHYRILLKAGRGVEEDLSGTFPNLARGTSLSTLSGHRGQVLEVTESPGAKSQILSSISVEFDVKS